MKIKLIAISKYGSEMGTFHSRNGSSRLRNFVFVWRHTSKDELNSLLLPSTLPHPDRLWRPQKGTTKIESFSVQVPLGRESVIRPDNAVVAYWETETTIC